MNIHRAADAFGLRERTGPILSDGTALRELIDFDNKQVSTRVLHDPEIYALEYRRIFNKCWYVLAHTAEIPNPGDYVLRQFGDDPVIVTRDSSGAINAFMNACSHRGMELCWSDRGNASTFKCPYHGWVFDQTGGLIGAPIEKEMYGENWDKSKHSARRLRVDARHGVVFATFDLDGPSLDEAMGDLLWYFDKAHANIDFEVFDHVPRQLVRANWKAAADQFSGDAYHGFTQHYAYVEMGLSPAGDGDNARQMMRGNPDRSQYGAMKVTIPPKGHTVTYNNDISFQWSMFPGSHGADRSQVLSNGMKVRAGYLGVIVPRGVGEFEYWRLGLLDRDEPEESKALRRANVKIFEQGLGLVDDWGSYPSIARGTKGPRGQEYMMRYELSEEGRPEGFAGPGTIYAGPYAMFREDGQWSFWEGWFNAMTADEA